MRSIRTLALLLLAAASPLLSGCGQLQPDASNVVVRFREANPLVRDRLVVTLDDSRVRWYLEGIDMVAGADGWLESRTLRTASSGLLAVVIALRGSGAGTAGLSELTLPLRPHERLRLDIVPAASLAEACVDCDGGIAIPLAPTDRPRAQDSLYVTWSSSLPPSGDVQARTGSYPYPRER